MYCQVPQCGLEIIDGDDEIVVDNDGNERSL